MYLTMAMHPELLNNSLFLRYYKKWQENPDSIVFASIAEFLMDYGMVEDAFKVCREGLKRSPAFASGHIMMAKIHKYRGNWEEADDELRSALALAPDNQKAWALLEEVLALKNGEEPVRDTLLRRAQTENAPAIMSGTKENETYDVPDLWRTVTMADIFASQGHVDQAKMIYNSILETDPSNEAARRGMERLA